jgi:hypothetical protein
MAKIPETVDLENLPDYLVDTNTMSTTPPTETERKQDRDTTWASTRWRTSGKSRSGWTSMVYQRTKRLLTSPSKNVSITSRLTPRRR